MQKPQFTALFSQCGLVVQLNTRTLHSCVQQALEEPSPRCHYTHRHPLLQAHLVTGSEVQGLPTAFCLTVCLRLLSPERGSPALPDSSFHQGLPSSFQYNPIYTVVCPYILDIKLGFCVFHSISIFMMTGIIFSGGMITRWSELPMVF